MRRMSPTDVLSREEDAYRVEAGEWWQVFDGGKDVLQGCSAELAQLAGGCEGSSPPRKGGHSITRDEPRLELDTDGRTDYWGLHQRCLSGGPMSVPPCESTMKSDLSFAVLYTVGSSMHNTTVLVLALRIINGLHHALTMRCVHDCIYLSLCMHCARYGAREGKSSE
jgi:hypothetical protein